MNEGILDFDESIPVTRPKYLQAICRFYLVAAFLYWTTYFILDIKKDLYKDTGYWLEILEMGIFLAFLSLIPAVLILYQLKQGIREWKGALLPYKKLGSRLFSNIILGCLSSILGLILIEFIFYFNVDRYRYNWSNLITEIIQGSIIPILIFVTVQDIKIGIRNRKN